jgi:predicted PurR-regulated permease PerM
LTFFGIDLNILPWPIFLLMIIVFFFIGWYLYVFIPISEELDDLKKQLPYLTNILNEINLNMRDISANLKNIDFENDGIVKSIFGQNIKIVF